MGIFRGVLIIFLFAGVISATETPCKEDLLFSSFSDSQFLKDVALYLTGSEKNAEKIYQEYRDRTKQLKPSISGLVRVPEKLSVFLEQVQFEKQQWKTPLSEKWQKSVSGQWLRREIQQSRVNGKPRVFYRSTSQLGGPIVWIAQSGEAGAEDFETEVAVRRPSNQNWDFFSYDYTGRLATEATFLTQKGARVVGSVPLTCLACHYDRNNRRFTPVSTLGNRLSDF